MEATSSDAAANGEVKAALSISEFVADDQPSEFLKMSMSRRVKAALVAEQPLREFLIKTLGSVQDAAVQALLPPLERRDEVIKRVVYSTSARRTLLVEFSSPELAAACRDRLNGQPCELINRQTLYIDFALPRKEKEERDNFQRVASISRTRALEDPSARVPGLINLPEFISVAQEQELLAFLDRDGGAHWETTVKARQVQHFGYTFDYETRRCDPSEQLPPMPPILQRLIDRVAAAGVMDTPDQITVNEYKPGQGIAAHIDTHSAFTTEIASLSLENEIVMEYRHPDGVTSESAILAPRSLLVMTGASRYEWTHAIQPRLFDVIDGVKVDRRRRLSVTFRKIQSTPCMCDFPIQCDAQDQFEAARLEKLKLEEQAQEGGEGSTSLAPTQVEQQFVHEFYETVAGHFSSTRYNPWPRVKQFVQALPAGSLIADLGCGNGKYMLCVNPTQSVVVGGDRSAKLVDICSSRGLNAMVCDALAVPIRSASCDAALSIAVLHHLSTLHHRVTAVKELVRVLRVGGRGVIYAWAHEQQKGSRRRFDESKQDFMVPWNLDKRFATPSEDDESEATEPVVVQRFCHMFKQGEIEELVAIAGGAEVEESYYDESNWAVVLRRVS